MSNNIKTDNEKNPNIQPKQTNPIANNKVGVDINKANDATQIYPVSTEKLYKAPKTPLNHPQYSQIMSNNKTWYHFSGRIGRLRYLSYQLLITILLYLFSYLLFTIFGAFSDIHDSFVKTIIAIIWLPLYIITTIYCVFIYPKRRLNDLGRSGWLALTMFLPFVNIVLVIFLIFAKGDDGVNQYGAPPRENKVIHYIAGIIVPLLFFLFVFGIAAATILLN